MQPPSTPSVSQLQARIAELEAECARLRAERPAPSAPAEGLAPTIYQHLVEHAPDGIAVAGSDTQIIYANESFRTMTGFGDRAIGLPFMELYPPDEQQRIRAEVTPAMRESGRWQGLLTARRPDGSLWSLYASTYTVRSADQPDRWVAIFRDVTGQREITTQLREKEASLQVLLENLPVVVAIVDRAGIFTLSTGKGLRDLGLAPGQVVGSSAIEMYRDHPDIVDSIGRGLAGETIELIHQVGDTYFDSRYEPLHDGDGQISGLLVLSTNVTQQIRDQEDRARLQAELISAQNAALRELSTPLIPVADDVVVMPLIGSIDSTRAQMVIETLLTGVAEQHARTAIIDITGVPIVDTQVANGLIRAAQAVKLLGAQVVLTGIRPEVAQTLVGLGTDLSGITTRSNLKSGIAFTLRS